MGNAIKVAPLSSGWHAQMLQYVRLLKISSSEIVDKDMRFPVNTVPRTVFNHNGYIKYVTLSVNGCKNPEPLSSLPITG